MLPSLALCRARVVCSLNKSLANERSVLSTLYNVRSFCSASPSQERLAKRLARSGVASRRAAEKLIEQGKVFVNGVKASLKNNMIVNESDVVTVYGKKIKKDHTKLWVHYKKPGVIVSHKSDETGRPALFPILKSIMGVDHIISVGRLDFNSEGLLLVTNNGELANKLEDPANEIPRVYRVRVRGMITEDLLTKLGSGVVIEGVKYKPMKVELEERDGSPANKWVTCTLTEGKNNELRRIFDHFNMPVSRIIRVKYGPLKSIAPGDTKSVPVQWITKLLNWDPHPKKDKEISQPQEKTKKDEKPSTKSKESTKTDKKVKVTTSNIGNVFGETSKAPRPEKPAKPQKTKK